jgi:hypothetical protein
MDTYLPLKTHVTSLLTKNEGMFVAQTSLLEYVEAVPEFPTRISKLSMQKSHPSLFHIRTIVTDTTRSRSIMTYGPNSGNPEGFPDMYESSKFPFTRFDAGKSGNRVDFTVIGHPPLAQARA